MIKHLSENFFVLAIFHLHVFWIFLGLFFSFSFWLLTFAEYWLDNLDDSVENLWIWRSPCILHHLFKNLSFLTMFGFNFLDFVIFLFLFLCDLIHLLLCLFLLFLFHIGWFDSKFSVVLVKVRIRFSNIAFTFIIVWLLWQI